jgi:hypothetical protein
MDRAHQTLRLGLGFAAAGAVMIAAGAWLYRKYRKPPTTSPAFRGFGETLSVAGAALAWLGAAAVGVGLWLALR